MIFVGPQKMLYVGRYLLIQELQEEVLEWMGVREPEESREELQGAWGVTFARGVTEQELQVVWEMSEIWEKQELQHLWEQWEQRELGEVLSYIWTKEVQRCCHRKKGTNWISHGTFLQSRALKVPDNLSHFSRHDLAYFKARSSIFLYMSHVLGVIPQLGSRSKSRSANFLAWL